MLLKKITVIFAASAACFFAACDDSSSASDDNNSSSSTEIQSSQDANSDSTGKSDSFSKNEEFTYVVYIDEETLKCESETSIFDISFDFGPSSNLKLIVDDKDIYKGKYRKDKDENGEEYYLLQTEELGELDYYQGEALIQIEPFMLYVKTQEDVQKGLAVCKQAIAEVLYEEL